MGKLKNFFKTAFKPVKKISAQERSPENVGRVGAAIIAATGSRKNARKNPDINKIDGFLKRTIGAVAGAVVGAGAAKAASKAEQTEAYQQAQELSNSVDSQKTNNMGIIEAAQSFLAGGSNSSPSAIANASDSFTYTGPGGGKLEIGSKTTSGTIAWMPILIVVGGVIAVGWLVKTLFFSKRRR